MKKKEKQFIQAILLSGLLILPAGFSYADTSVISREVQITSEPSKNPSAIEEEQSDLKKEKSNFPNIEGFLDIEKTVQKVLNQNPEFSALEAKWKASGQKAPQVRSLPDPTLAYGYFIQKTQTRAGPQRQKVSFTQKLPFPGKLSLKGTMAEKKAEAIENSYEEMRLNLIAKAKAFIYHYFFIQKSIQINLENQELVQQFIKLAETQYKVGVGAASGKMSGPVIQKAGSMNDVLQAQLELSKLMKEEINLRADKKIIQGKINRLMDKKPQSPIGKAPNLDFPKIKKSLGNFQKSAIQSRPALKGLNALIERARQGIRLATLDGLPDFFFGADYGEVQGGTNRNFPHDGEDNWMIRGGITLPIYRTKRRAEVAQAKQEKRQQTERLRELKSRILRRVEQSYDRTLAARETVELYRNALLPQSQSNLETARNGYLTGRNDFLTLITAQRILFKTELGEAKALAGYHARRADLEREVGEKK